MKLYFEVIKNWNVLNSRSSKQKYWKFILINISIIFISSLITSFISSLLSLSNNVSIFIYIYALIITIPTFSLSVRRLHDIGHSGGWALLSFIPVFTWLLILFLSLKKGDSKTNEYGSVQY